MSYAKNPDDDVQIYYEIEGSGPPLILLHGLSGSCDTWRESGYVDALRDDYQLILIDSRGHGKSDKVDGSEAYSRRRQAPDVIAVLDDLGIEQAHFWSYSFGTFIGYQAGATYPGRFRSLILGGQHCFSIPEDDAWLAEIVPPYLEALKSETPSANLASYAAGYEALLVDTGMENELSQIVAPVLAYAGDEDQLAAGAKQSACAIPGASFVSLGRVDHVGGLDAISRILPIARAFLERVEADRDS